MKVLRTIGAIICWVIIYTIVSFIASKVMRFLAGIIDTSTTIGSLILLAITLPTIAGVNFYLCLYTGIGLLQTKKQALITLLVCGVWVVLLLFYSPTNVITWALAASTIFALLLIYLGKLGEEKENGNS